MPHTPEERAAFAASALASKVKPDLATMSKVRRHIVEASNLPRWAALASLTPGWAGACSFCFYAEADDLKTAASCRTWYCTDSRAPQNIYRDDTVACFDNHKEPRDRLCIMRDFEQGRSNIEAMPLAARERTLRKLLEGAARDAARRRVALPEMACLNPADKATVPWTHVHLFEKGLNPDGGVEDHAYCTRFRDAVGAGGVAGDFQRHR